VPSSVHGRVEGEQQSLQSSDDTAQLGRVFRRGLFTTLAFDLITSALAAASVVVLIRGLSVSSYAYTTLFLTFAQFSGAGASGGVRTRYLREEAERVSRMGEEVPPGAFVESLLRGTLLILVLGAGAVPIAILVGFGSGLGGASVVILSATGFAIGLAALELAVAHYQARRRFLSAGLLHVARAVAILAAAFAIVLTSESIAAISIWFIASMIAVGAVAVAPIARRSLHRQLARASWLRLKSEELWLSFYYVAAAGFAYVDVMVAGALLNHGQVASLGAALRYLAVILGAIPALGAILRVRTSQFDVVDSPANQKTMILAWIRRGSLPTALLVGSAVLLAPVLIPVIDKGRYPDSIPTFQIFLGTAVCAYLTAPAANVLMAQRRFAMLAAIYAVGLLVNLVGDIAVARPFGVVGIAIVSTSVYAAIDVSMVVQAVRHATRQGGERHY
jgi:O-antigen/teichoic acid export membrane protein